MVMRGSAASAAKYSVPFTSMSRIGKKPVPVPAGVTVSVAENVVTVRGPKGELTLVLLPEVTIELGEGTVHVGRIDDERDSRARHGLIRTLLANMITGVSVGFTKKLEIIGVGYKAQGKGTAVTLSLGHSHPIEYAAPKGVDIQNDPENKQMLVVSGIDKQLVGQVAADIRDFRSPEPYKGKGVRYAGEFVLRKVGKAAGKSSG